MVTYLLQVLGMLLVGDEPRLEFNSVLREIYYYQLGYYQTNIKYTVVKQPLMECYSAKDLNRFDDMNNLYPWQKKLLDIIKNPKSDNFNEPDGKTIISIVDKQGKKGKSSFVK